MAGSMSRISAPNNFETTTTKSVAVVAESEEHGNSKIFMQHRDAPKDLSLQS